jgi:hypothetical protein
MGAFLIVLRVGALVLALLGSAGSLFLAYQWRSDFEKEKEKIALGLAFLEFAGEIEKEVPPDPKQAEALAKARAAYDQLARAVRAIRFLFAGAALGLLGGLLALLGRTSCAAALLLVAAAGPAVLLPLTLVFTCPLVLGGLLALGASLLGLGATPRPSRA